MERKIRGTNYRNLDLLLAGLSHRNLDLALASVKHSKRRLHTTLHSLEHDCDHVFLDCAPSIGLVSENIFGAADHIVVPFVPTTLSLVSYEKLLKFFDDQGMDSSSVVTPNVQWVGGNIVKRIVLVRHATAVKWDSEVSDFSRSLRGKGRKEARAMAKWYARSGRRVDVMVSSPADRAIQTARIFAKQLGYPAKKIVQKKKLYDLLEPPDFLELTKTLDDKYESVMVFGHDPSFSGFAQSLVKGFEEGLPKCSVFEVSVRRKAWRTLKLGDGRQELFESPERLLRLKGLAEELRTQVSAQVEKSIVNTLSELGIKCQGKEAEYIRSVSAKLARKLAVAAQPGDGEAQE